MHPSLQKAIALIRVTRVMLHLAYGLAIALIYPWLGQSVRRRILQRWSIELLQIFNVRINITADEAMHCLQPGILVTNHISWLDVFVLNAVIPMRFVAKSEVQRWPLIGWLCARAQTLFIERGRARDAARINKQLVELLQNGECLAVFPEGTTTDGSQVGTFHASLLQPAIEVGAHIHPVTIRYHDATGTHSTAPAYIDDLTMIASLRNILRCRNLHVHLVVTPSLVASGCDRRTLARRAHQQISTALDMLHTTAYNLPACPCPERQTGHEENLQSLYGLLLLSTLSRKEIRPAID